MRSQLQGTNYVAKLQWPNHCEKPLVVYRLVWVHILILPFSIFQSSSSDLVWDFALVLIVDCFPILLRPEFVKHRSTTSRVQPEARETCCTQLALSADRLPGAATESHSFFHHVRLML